VTHQRDVERHLFLGRFQRFLLGAERDHVVAGSLQHALAEQGKFLVGGEIRSSCRDAR